MKFIALSFVLMAFSAPSAAINGLSPQSVYQLEQKWTSQKGKEQALSDLRGKPAVIAMVFTSCPATCPAIVSDMKRFDSLLSKQEKRQLQYVLFSIDPERDTPAALLAFSKKMKLDDRWTLLTSKPDQVRELSAVLGFNYKPLDDGDFTHSTTVYLLSAGGELIAQKQRESDTSGFLEQVKRQIKNSKK